MFLASWAAGLAPAAALLFGAVLAPTDPVLAADVRVGEPTVEGTDVVPTVEGAALNAKRRSGSPLAISACDRSLKNRSSTMQRSRARLAEGRTPSDCHR